MNPESIRKAFALFLLLAAGVHAAAVDLSGAWVGQISDSRAFNTTIILVQEGSKVRALETDPERIAFFGENSFVATVDGTSLRGKLATALKPEFKDFCGKNWGNWEELELELSSDGNRLEGRWKRFSKNINEVGCPVTKEEWKPYVLTRTPKPTPPPKQLTEPAPVKPKQPTPVAPPKQPRPAVPELPQPVAPIATELPEIPLAPSPNYLLGGLSLLGLAAVFFFIRGAYENYLVGRLKRSPHTAGLAGWSLFGGLLFGSAIGSAALTGSSYLVLPVLVFLAVLSLLCLVLCAVFSSKK